MLEGPEVKFITVTFPEGSWLTEFAERLDEDTDIRGRDFLRVLESGKVKSSILPEDSTNFEGLLFPSTYQLVEEDTAQYGRPTTCRRDRETTRARSTPRGSRRWGTRSTRSSSSLP